MPGIIASRLRPSAVIQRRGRGDCRLDRSDLKDHSTVQSAWTNIANITKYYRLVEIRGRENDGGLTGALVHEYAHTLVHFDVNNDTERSKREIEPKPLSTSLGGTAGPTPASRRSTSQPGVAQSRSRSRAAQTDQSYDRGTHPRARRAACSLNCLTNKLPGSPPLVG